MCYARFVRLSDAALEFHIAANARAIAETTEDEVRERLEYEGQQLKQIRLERDLSALLMKMPDDRRELLTPFVDRAMETQPFAKWRTDWRAEESTPPTVVAPRLAPSDGPPPSYGRMHGRCDAVTRDGRGCNRGAVAEGLCFQHMRMKYAVQL